jgi:SAM-dependent methyltransferase
MIAVEPSRQMILQRPDRSNVVQGVAEALPFRDASFDAAMAVLTLHHWTDQSRGIEESVRVARRRVVILTWDSASEGFWLVQDYFPELLQMDRRIFPSVEELRAWLGPSTVQPIPIPADCTDGLLGAYWRRPHAYLDPAIRAGMSSFARTFAIEARLHKLEADLASGGWEQRHQRLLETEALDIGYRLVIAERG